MKNKILLVAMLTILAAIAVYFVTGQKDLSLVNPKSSPVTAPVSTPAPPNAPKTFQFNESTDLKVELEKVNPEVLDSDFE
ncbi:hypothetical protein HYS92_01420 [Candidatus Daviesbacteria bacterium]|nr:hypothetical protein [Candidatus Daviesbacteria bacterium]